MKLWPKAVHVSEWEHGKPEDTKLAPSHQGISVKSHCNLGFCQPSYPAQANLEL